MGTENTPPSINITDPANNTYVNGNVSILTTATDNLEVRNVLFEYQNSTSSNTVLCNSTSSPYSCVWGTANYSDAAGGYDILVTAFDTNYNNASMIRHFVIDRKIPQLNNINVFYPTGQSAAKSGQQITLKVNVSDFGLVGAGINATFVDLSSLNSSGNVTMNLESGSKSFGSWSLWNFTVAINMSSTGNVYARVSVYDNATPLNNLNRTEQFTVYLDNQAPAFTAISNQTAEYGAALGYDINATDDFGINCFGVNDTANFKINCSGYLENNTVLNIGLYNLNITINDTVNNQNSSLMMLNVTDTTSPTTVLNSPVSGYWNDTSSPFNVTFGCSATDNYILTNISLYITNNRNTSFTLNQTTTIIGISNSSNWTLGLITGNYTWNCLAYDSFGYGDWAEDRTLSINYTSLDTDNDGLPDSLDALLYNESNVTTSGIINLGVTIGGNRTNESYSGMQEVRFLDQNILLFNFSHNFSQSNLDLSKITIIKATNSIIINMSGQLQGNKAIYLADNNFASLCIKDAEIGSINNITSGCNGDNETDFTSCLGSSATLNDLSCTDEGSTIKINNLKHSGARGTPAISTEQPSGEGGAGGGGGGDGTITPISVEISGSEIIYGCSENSDCKQNQYCFEQKCYDAECSTNNECKKDESCWNYRCIKWFDVEILDFESPAKVGEFFDFTFFLKSMAEINGDVEILFWIEQDGNQVTSGQDTFYFGSFEEKTKTKKLFLPKSISSGTYTFYIEVRYGTYTASAHRTIEIEVKEGMATIEIRPDSGRQGFYGLVGRAFEKGFGSPQNIIYSLIVFGFLILFLIAAGFFILMKKLSSRHFGRVKMNEKIKLKEKLNNPRINRKSKLLLIKEYKNEIKKVLLSVGWPKKRIKKEQPYQKAQKKGLIGRKEIKQKRKDWAWYSKHEHNRYRIR